MIIEATHATPAITIDPGLIKIIGRSIPEDSAEFYEPVILAIRDYFKLTIEKTEIYIHLEYINSGSKKFLTTLLGICNEAFANGHNLSIIWNYDYDDESMQELGNDLKTMWKVPFEIREVN